MYAFGPFRLDPEAEILFSDGEPLPLGKRAVALLRVLVERAGKPVSKDALLEAAWAGLVVEESNLPVQIAAVRKVLGREHGGERWIETLPRRGYRFVGPVDRADRVSAATASSTRQAGPAHVAATPRMEPQRRQLTIMVCTVVSMPPAGDLDPEELSERIAPFHNLVADVASRFGGFIAQLLGDGAHVYFGYPAAHEYDAEHAVRAGLAILAAVSTPKTPSDVTLLARVGISTGMVVVGEQPGAADIKRVVIGEAPNLAARLQTVAAPGELIIAGSTRRLVGDMFDCHPAASDQLTGLSPSVEAWQVRAETVGVSRFDVRRAGKMSPFAGRQEEMDLLVRRWEQAKTGEGRVVLLSGEPGIGKSRIAETLLARLAGEPHTPLRYFCSPHHTNSPLYPFIAQLERAAGFEPASSAEAKLDKLEALIKRTSRNLPRDLALIAGLLSVPTDGRYPAPALSPQQKREMTLAALLDQLDGEAGQGTVLIVVEDAHWIDPTSLDLLDRTVARAADLPLLLLITLRPEVEPA
jgi:DNA-binding winged helix-turn-helix (wHTH) protein